MRTTLALVGRNLTIYFRDRVGVFLSLLSALILLLLYTLFLGSLQVDTIQESLPNASDDEVRAFVDTWVSIRGRRDHRILRLGAVDIARGGQGRRWWGPEVSTSACGVTGS